MPNEFEMYETPLLVDIEEACADCAVCITGGGPEVQDPG